MDKTPAYWRGTLEHDLNWAKGIMIGEGRLLPMFIMHNRDGSITPLMCGFKSDSHKAAVYRFISILALAMDCDGFSFMCEGWMKLADIHEGETHDAAYKRAMVVRPMDDENRKEVVTLMLVYRDEADERQVMSALEEIERGVDAQPCGFKTISTAGAITEGAVIDILREDRPDRDVVFAAQMFCNLKAIEIMESLGVQSVELEPVATH
jgi:hypothetical protein